MCLLYLFLADTIAKYLLPDINNKKKQGGRMVASFLHF